MEVLYYCCTPDNNPCLKKEECMRYINAKDNFHTGLYNYACRPENDYHLFIVKDIEETDEKKEEKAMDNNEIKETE